MTTPLTTHIQAIAAKIETTAGTPESLSGTQGAILATNPEITDDTPTIERSPAMSTLGQYQSVPGLPVGKFKCSLELKGLGSAGLPLWAKTFLACSGIDTSGTLAEGTAMVPTSSASKKSTCTVGIWNDGFYQVLAGCMFDFTITLERGKKALIEFMGQGIPQAPADSSTPSPTMETSTPILVADGILGIGSGPFNPVFEKIVWKAGNQIILRDYTYAFITNRKPSIEVDTELTSVAGYDWYGIWKAATQFDTNLVVGTATHNIITLDAPSTQWKKQDLADQKGIRGVKAMGQINRNSDAGDDDWSITFS